METSRCYLIVCNLHPPLLSVFSLLIDREHIQFGFYNVINLLTLQTMDRGSATLTRSGVTEIYRGWLRSQVPTIMRAVIDWIIGTGREVCV